MELFIISTSSRRDVVSMSFSPKDEHEAQVQFALERGIPGISAVMGPARLPSPAKSLMLFIALIAECPGISKAVNSFWSLTVCYCMVVSLSDQLLRYTNSTMKMLRSRKAMWRDIVSITKDKLNDVGVATYRKASTNDCYEKQSKSEPPLCKESDDLNAAWNITLQACMHSVPVEANERGSQWPEQWPARLVKTPYWLSSSQVGVYGKPATEDFKVDTEHWKGVVTKSYLTGIGIDWSSVRNVMDMRAAYGGLLLL